MSGRIIPIVGISGVGKTSLLAAFVARYSPYFPVSGGDIALALNRGITNRDHLRDRPASQILADQMRMAEGLSRIRSSLPEGTHVLFDAHVILNAPGGIRLPVPWRAFQLCKPDAFVCLAASPKTIFRQRALDTTRDREVEDLETLAERQDVTMRLSQAYARLCGAPFHLLWEPTVEGLHDILERIIA